MIKKTNGAHSLYLYTLFFPTHPLRFESKPCHMIYTWKCFSLFPMSRCVNKEILPVVTFYISPKHTGTKNLFLPNTETAHLCLDSPQPPQSYIQQEYMRISKIHTTATLIYETANVFYARGSFFLPHFY